MKKILLSITSIMDIGDITGEKPVTPRNHEVQIDIRLVERTGKKYQTMVCGLDGILNMNQEELAKIFKKKCNCVGFVTEHKTQGFVLILTGDHREFVKQYLIDHGYAKIDHIKLHGI